MPRSARETFTGVHQCIQVVMGAWRGATRLPELSDRFAPRPRAPAPPYLCQLARLGNLRWIRRFDERHLGVPTALRRLRMPPCVAPAHGRMLFRRSAQSWLFVRGLAAAVGAPREQRRWPPCRPPCCARCAGCSAQFRRLSCALRCARPLPASPSVRGSQGSYSCAPTYNVLYSSRKTDNTQLSTDRRNSTTRSFKPAAAHEAAPAGASAPPPAAPPPAPSHGGSAAAPAYTLSVSREP